MEYRKIENNEGKSVYVSLSRDEVRTDFDTGVTKSELYYHNDKSSDDDVLYEVRVELSREFIDDTYNLREDASIDVMIQACLNIGVHAYEEKQGNLQEIEKIVGLKANSRLRYISRIDMKSVGS